MEKWTEEEMQTKMNKIHNMDCLEFMKQVPDNYFDLVLTDPPYGIDLANMNMGIGNTPKASKAYNRKWEQKDWDKNTPSIEVFEEMFRISRNQIIWGGNYFDLPPCKFYILWDKEIPDGLSFADCEMAWTSYDKAPKMFRYSAYRNKSEKVHPTQKPPQLFDFCIEKAKDVKTVFDPFMGSGTTAISAKSKGIEWCGTELESDYCEMANKRLSKVQTSMFAFMDDLMRVNIENAILSTFLYANEMSNDLSWIFKLDTSIFYSPFRKRVAEKINAVEDDAYGFTSYEIEESVSGTQYEQDFIEILAQTPLSNVNKYHDKLVEEIRLEQLI